MKSSRWIVLTGAIALIAAGSLLAETSAASAHERRQVKDYTFVVGFLSEPARPRAASFNRGNHRMTLFTKQLAQMGTQVSGIKDSHGFMDGLHAAFPFAVGEPPGLSRRSSRRG